MQFKKNPAFRIHVKPDRDSQKGYSVHCFWHTYTYTFHQNRKKTSQIIRCALWCFDWYADIGISGLGNSTYMKVILAKKFTLITIIYHTKIQFAKMSWTMKNKCNFLNFCHFYVLKNSFLGANFPRIQTFSQIKTLYGK